MESRYRFRAKKVFLFAVVLSAIILSFNVFADTLHLKNGTQLEGMVIEETPEYIIFDVYGGKVKFFRSEITRIVKAPLKVQEPKPTPQVAQSKTPAKAKKDGVRLPELKGMKMPEITATGWKGELLRRVVKYVERQSNPRALIQNFSIPTLLFWFLEALFVFLIMALFIKWYIRLCGVLIPYGRAALFLFKFNIISNIVIFLFSAVGTAAAGPTAGRTQEVFAPGQPIAIAASILLVFGIFFWLADRDLESGFFKSIGLFVVVVFAYLLGGVTFSLFGLY